MQELAGILFSSVQSLSHVQLFATPWTAACQASLSITNSLSLLKLMSTESMMPSKKANLYCHRQPCRQAMVFPRSFTGCQLCAKCSAKRGGERSRVTLSRQDQSPGILETLWNVREHLTRNQRRDFERSYKNGNIQHMVVLSV